MIIKRCATPEEHDYNGCKCKKCGIMRDEGHQWVVELCEKCGGTGFTGHSLSYGDPDYGDPNYKGIPCDCAKPRRTHCAICGKEKKAPFYYLHNTQNIKAGLLPAKPRVDIISRLLYKIKQSPFGFKTRESIGRRSQ